jgi:hypothetical protein
MIRWRLRLRLSTTTFLVLSGFGLPPAARGTSCERFAVIRSSPLVAGQVFNQELQKLQNHRIIIVDQRRARNGKQPACDVLTDTKGFFQCPQLAAGSYLISGVQHHWVQFEVDEGLASELFVIRWLESESPCALPAACGVKMTAPAPLDEAPPCLSETKRHQSS